MQDGKKNIIPVKGFPTQKGNQLDLQSIAFWLATGFFLENDTFWKEVKWNMIDFDKQPWSYEPRDLSFDQAVTEFADIFHRIIARDLQDKQVILPLSGGLDSRSLAVALKHLGIIPYTYSYRFQDGFNETKYGKEIAEKLDWPFQEFEIPLGYLWSMLESTARQNHCYTEFSHARQVAIMDKVSKEGDIWLLGHWGDALFNDSGVSNDLPFNEQLGVIKKKILKRGGKELASDLWNVWGLPGDFIENLDMRLNHMHGRVSINNANARIRAFKSLYWATRWTSTNLTYFDQKHSMSLPYYDDEMCRFIMTIPEKYLSGRQIQIEYIKRYGKGLANIEWQEKKPYNLYNYHKFRTSSHLPYRFIQKTNRILNKTFKGQKLIQRNWENQFLQLDNPEKLKSWFFENEEFLKLVPRSLVEKYYQRFLNESHVHWSHPISMLLTLSVFCKQQNFEL
ncbi:asparagine synthase C-terminal domain-containing protein [Roseivirga sp. E12]|uniref:asparagine synthase-related protein n=1 Tax=Roseivirga sp. E12 TaxID=2819237 RepID=UPI001ABC8058|nr:asparagine synthase C-terminal domain-containing protein [Roseivirga sp. E12]MBO3699081.1 asparagine synthase [Roseivirga sp. E12]